MPENNQPPAESTEQSLETAKLGIWAFLATEVLLFGGLFTAYTVFRVGNPDMFHSEYLKLNRLLGAINTVVLVTSSLTVALGIAAIRQGKQQLLKFCLALTLLLAAAFLGIKPQGVAGHQQLLLSLLHADRAPRHPRLRRDGRPHHHARHGREGEVFGGVSQPGGDHRALLAFCGSCLDLSVSASVLDRLNVRNLPHRSQKEPGARSQNIILLDSEF